MMNLSAERRCKIYWILVANARRLKMGKMLLRKHHNYLDSLVKEWTTELTKVNAELKQEMEERNRAEAALLKANADAEVAGRELIEVNIQLEEVISKANEMGVQAEIASIAKSQFLVNMSHEIPAILI